jgi:tRNA-splicing ligase RtcB
MPVLQNRERPRPVSVYTDEIEAARAGSSRTSRSYRAYFIIVAAMPDVHTGIVGATVGSVIATRAIIPAAVGVDIGCGMIAARLTLSAAQLDERSLKRDI